MCGIAGIINYHGHDLHRLKDALLHRGPDEQAIYVDENIALIHTRLAIQDIALGKQPFHHGHCSIVFNGEIYNHQALRKKLTHFSFKTQSDTETLLYLYLTFGTNMFDMLDGMFAFCILDRKENCLFIARDRAGKKPLYYHRNQNGFLFASELNAIRSLYDLEINHHAIECYLRTGFIYKPYTPYQDVFKLDAGSFMHVNLQTHDIEQKKYYHVLPAYQEDKLSVSFPEAVNLVESCLKRSVDDRLTSSDVDIGIFLSGGIDSNLIVAMAAAHGRQLKTFTVKTSGPYDESSLAKQTANKYRTQHTELTISMDIKNDIEHILSLYGEPFMDSSAVPSFYISQAARKEVGVVLNGDGADELFAGYRRYVPIAGNFMRYAKWLSSLNKWLPKPNAKQSGYNYFHRLLAMSTKANLDFYLSATSDIFEDIYIFDSNHILSEMNQFVSSIFNDKQLSSLSKLLYLDFNLLLFSDLLVKMDIATMAHSLEARSPFLSKYLLDLAPRLPDQYKVNKVVTKRVLRELAKKYLPSALINQPKRGFEVPLKNWVNIDLKEQIHDRLRSCCYAKNYMSSHFISNLLDNKLGVSEEKRAKMIWNIFCLEIWHQSNKKNVFTS